MTWPDRHPVLALLITCALLYAGLRIWSLLHDGPLLLARETGKDRVGLYGQFTSSSVALLGVSLTVLAILVAFPDRPRVQQLRQQNSWRLLQATLLTRFLTLVFGHIASAVDGASIRKEWLEQLVVST